MKKQSSLKKSAMRLLLVALLTAGAFLSVATSSSTPRRKHRSQATLLLKNPFPIGVWCRIYGPVRRVVYLTPRTRRTLSIPAGRYRLYWKRPAFMTRYRYYRSYYFRPGSLTRWKVGMR